MNTINQKNILLLTIILIFSVSGFAQKKVLFLGNSYTYAYNIPEILHQMVKADGDTIYIESNTPGGCTLAHPDNGHLYNDISIVLINSMDWDYVVLQEQSQFPVIQHFRDLYTYTGAEQLNEIIKGNSECTRTLFFMTWGREEGGMQCIDGYCSADFVDYFHMQDSLSNAYLTMTHENEAEVCPAGEAWRAALLIQPDLELWSGDGSHPSLLGSYLNACSFYSAITHRSPVGNTFNPGLDPEMLEFLQTTAYETVYGNIDLWNIDTLDVAASFDYTIDFDQVIFENQSFLGEDFMWDFGDGNYSTEENPVHAYLENDQYEVKLFALNGCKVDSIVKTVNIDFLNTNKENHDMKVFPIPFSDYIFFENMDLDKNSRIELLDIYGNVVRSVENSGSDMLQFDNLSELSNGIYFLRATEKQKNIVLIKQS